MLSLRLFSLSLRRKRLSEHPIDWWLETLLANQNKPAGGGPYAPGGSTGSNPSADSSAEGGAQQQHAVVLSGGPDTEMGDNDNSAFGYSVQNGGAEF